MGYLLSLQGKLLRVLEERTIRRIGGQKEIPIEVTIIATTNRNLSEAVEKEMQTLKEKDLKGYPKYECLIVHGTPFLEILRTAKEKNVELIVVGTHGRTGLDHVLFGSTAEKVVRRAPCPVLSVRLRGRN
jgi:nucleotide-binding universal stress UspA family protein